MKTGDKIFEQNPKIRNDETMAREAFLKMGYTVNFTGWPDFLISKDGKTLGLEVKRGFDRINHMQAAMHSALKRAGIEVLICRNGILLETDSIGVKTIHRPKVKPKKVKNRPSCGVRLTPEKEQEARQLLAEAMPVAQIARAIGVPYWRVYRMTFNNPAVKLTVGRPRLKTACCGKGTSKVGRVTVPIQQRACK